MQPRLPGLHEYSAGSGRYELVTYRDIIEEEDYCRRHYYGIENTSLNLRAAEIVQQLIRGGTLGFDPGDGQISLLQSQESRRIGPIYQDKERKNGDAAGDDALDEENHAPAFHGADVVESQDRRSKQAAKGARQRRSDNVHGKPEGQLAATIPPTEVICDTREHASFKESEQKAYSTDRGEVGDKCHGDGSYTESKRQPRKPDGGAHDFAGDIGWYIEDDVGDVEDGEHRVEIISMKMEVFLQPGKACIPNVRSIDEAE